ncbi:hypothetical protein L843_2847 [Mycobacterium intracellulare MIN_061107_1834]|nr:hypothetical protein L843_2847 [Mycobacterium intracellulare MIN_061107_1834]
MMALDYVAAAHGRICAGLWAAAWGARDGQAPSEPERDQAGVFVLE